MSGPISITVVPVEIFAAVWIVLAIAIIVYVARLPAKGRYYLPFMLYAVIGIGFSLINIAENTGVTIQESFQISLLVGLFGPAAMFTFQYHFILNFATEKKGWFQKITLAGQYVYWAIIAVTTSLGLTYTKSAGYGVLTPTGYNPPNQNAPWFKSLQTPAIHGVPIINQGFTYDYIVITLLSLYALLSYYRSSKSPLVKSQVRYLCAGVLLDYAAVLWHGHVSVPYKAPDIQIPLYCVTLLVLLLGLTRHQFRKVRPEAEIAVAVPQSYALEEGRSYLSRDNESSFGAFSELVKNGREGLCVTRIFPDDVRRTYGLQTTPIRWLAEERREDAISATDLLGLSLTVKDFMEMARKPVVILQGVEYLARVNGFTPVIRLLDGLYEEAGKKNGIILIPVSQNALEPREDAILVAETTPQPAPRPA